VVAGTAPPPDAVDEPDDPPEDGEPRLAGA
jgi:hypothetical protein